MRFSPGCTCCYPPCSEPDRIACLSGGTPRTATITVSGVAGALKSAAVCDAAFEGSFTATHQVDPCTWSMPLPTQANWTLFATGECWVWLSLIPGSYQWNRGRAFYDVYFGWRGGLTFWVDGPRMRAALQMAWIKTGDTYNVFPDSLHNRIYPTTNQYYQDANCGNWATGWPPPDWTFTCDGEYPIGRPVVNVYGPPAVPNYPPPALCPPPNSTAQFVSIDAADPLTCADLEAGVTLTWDSALEPADMTDAGCDLSGMTVLFELDP